MVHRKAAILANGEIHDLKWIASQIKTFPFFAAVDGGLNYCYKMRLKPDLVVSDLDSVEPEVLQFYATVPTQIFPRDKDETDLALAINILLQRGFQEIVLFGALGKRIDHTVGNLHLMYRYADQVRMETEEESVFFLQKQEILHTFTGQVISLMPFNGKVTGVVSKGLKWELNQSTLDSFFLSQSNVCLEPTIQLSFEEGALLCCMQRSRREK